MYEFRNIGIGAFVTPGSLLTPQSQNSIYPGSRGVWELPVTPQIGESYLDSGQ